MKLPLSHRCRARREGFTLAELLIATGVGALIGIGAVFLLIEAAKENVRSIADMTVEQAATDLEGKVAQCLRGMSAREAVVYTSPVTDEQSGFHGYQRIIVARGAAPDYPRAELRFDTDAKRAVFLANRNQTGTQQVLMHSRSNSVMLRNLCFFPSMKSDSTPDNSLINVVIEVDDAGSSRRNTTCNPARVQRTFSVKMRND